MEARTWRSLALGLVVGGGFLYLAFHKVPLADLGVALRRIDGRWLAVAVGISLLIMFLRAWRWHLELRPLERVPLGRLWVITAVAYMAINLMPARLGEIVRPWLLARRSSVSFSNVIGNLVLEKTLDSVVTLVYVLVGLLAIGNLPLWVRRGALFPAALATGLVALVVVLWWRGEVCADRRLARWLPEPVGGALKRILSAVRAGMQVLPDPFLLGTVFFVSLALWFLPILSSYVMILAFDLRVPFGAAVLVFIFIGFGTALPNLPGMIGAYQYACQLALGLFGVSDADGLAYGLVLNAVQVFTLIAQGLVALPLAGVRFADLRRAGREAS